MINYRKKDALDYHEQGKPGKIEIKATKPLASQFDLALAYSPGVAEPCKEIHKDPAKVYRYTAKGNLVAVISNGTAVLGLGNLGPEASKPVMEGKGVLFKRFAGIDVFDIEINETDPKKFIQVVKALEPTFGGVNLEDIKAPEAFEIEQTLRDEMNIPVMHDDQHGTAIIASAGLLNALELTDKKIEDIRIVVNGAGAAAISCADLILELGADPKNLVMVDSKGCIRKDRGGLDEIKSRFATELNVKELEDALKGADFFLGLSVADVLTPEMLTSMNDQPIVFALANPNPEIKYDLALKTRDDAIMATGRSDHPNQVNNVLGFPFISRGALDVRATEINKAMKLAAVRALASLAKEPVPDLVKKAYGEKNLEYGRHYIIPKPLDPRLITKIPPAVAKAAMESKVAKEEISDWAKYEADLLEKIGVDNRLIGRVLSRAKASPKTIVFAEGDNPKVLEAASIIHQDGIGKPILLGSEEVIKKYLSDQNIDLGDVPIIDPVEKLEWLDPFANILYEKRRRKGVTEYLSKKMMRNPNYFAAAMVESGKADVMISGMNREYPKAFLPALHVIGTTKPGGRAAGMYALTNQQGIFFLADATISRDPSPENLLDIIGLTAERIKSIGVEPRIALLSYSNLGSAKGSVPSKMQKAVQLAWDKYPDLIIDGEFQAHVALSHELQKKYHPFSKLAEKGANTLIFPSLAAGHIAYNLLLQLGGMEGLGPILMGMNKPVQIMQRSSTVRDIVNMAAVGVIEAQNREENT